MYIICRHTDASCESGSHNIQGNTGQLLYGITGKNKWINKLKKKKKKQQQQQQQQH